MESNIKHFSELERFEIININDGDKYSYLGNNDVIIDSEGRLKLIILNKNRSRFTLFTRDDYNEVSWDSVRKIGSRTIIIDVDNEDYRKYH